MTRIILYREAYLWRRSIYSTQARHVVTGLLAACHRLHQSEIATRLPCDTLLAMYQYIGVRTILDGVGAMWRAVW